MSPIVKNDSLAIEGGDCEVSRSFPAWPQYSSEEIKAVTDVLVSGKVNYWTGNVGKTFENEFANYFGLKHAVALSNGSVALEVALKALKIGEGDEVIVTPRTFIASASSISICGATPVFVDVDRESQNITAETIQTAITSNTKAILLVHLAGWPCEMDTIIDIAHRHNLKVIEDCAQAHGAKYNNQYVGTFGNVATFSFCQDKIISTGGEGGMLLTNDKSIWSFAWSYKDHGKNVDCLNHSNGFNNNLFRWVHDSIGSNYRMTEIQAAIGLEQLHKLNDWVLQRQKNAEQLTSYFKNIPALRVTIPNKNIDHAYYKYYVFVRNKLLKPGWTRDKIVQAINKEGVPCFTGSCSEVYKEKAFVDAKIFPSKDFKIAKELGETSLMFNVHPMLNTQDIESIYHAVKKVFNHASI